MLDVVVVWWCGWWCGWWWWVGGGVGYVGVFFLVLWWLVCEWCWLVMKGVYCWRDGVKLEYFLVKVWLVKFYLGKCIGVCLWCVCGFVVCCCGWVGEVYELVCLYYCVMFDWYFDLWGFVFDGGLILIVSGGLLLVVWYVWFVMLKVVMCDEECCGNVLMVWWNG